MLRDGVHQTAVHTGLAPYRPNSLDGGQPLVAGTTDGGYVQVARPVDGVTVRSSPVSFDDHLSPAAVFYRSLPQVQANVDADLCAQVAAGLGLPAPKGSPPADVTLSPALSQVVLTARSIEFDARSLSRAARLRAPISSWSCPCRRHSGIPTDGAGVVTGDAVVKSFTDQLVTAVGLHRAWERAPLVMASAIPPGRVPGLGRPAAAARRRPRKLTGLPRRPSSRQAGRLP